MPIADLGNILAGNLARRLYFALLKVVCDLIKKENYSNRHWWIPGLDFALYRAYDELEQMVNVTYR
jgi:hypothetical protein